MRQLLTAGDPAGVWIQEVNRAQRGAQACRLPFPAFAAVHRVPHDAFIADGPALVAVHELDPMKSSVFEISHVPRIGGGGNDYTQPCCEQRMSHDLASCSDTFGLARMSGARRHTHEITRCLRAIARSQSKS